MSRYNPFASPMSRYNPFASVGEVEPRRAGVVELGQRAVFEARGAGGVARLQSSLISRPGLFSHAASRL